MDAVAVIAATLLLSSTGAFAPGPLSVSAMILGASRGPFSGIGVALGHMLAELPYVLALMLSYAVIRESLNVLEKPMALAAAAFMVYFAYATVRQGAAEEYRLPATNPVLVGVTLTMFNPYFLLWWATVGYPIISYMYEAPAMIPAIYCAHVSLDYAWLTLLAYLGGAGAKLLGSRGYRVMLWLLALLLLAFAADITARSMLGLRLLPF